MPPEASFEYSLCGWRLRSDIVFIELLPWSTDQTHPVDVHIILGDAEELHCPHQISLLTRVDGHGRLLIEETDGSRILVRDRSTVVIQASERPDWTRIRLRLLSVITAFLGYRRNALALHAAVIEINGHAIAFCGESGAGKSTLATLLVRRGHALMSDDVAITSSVPLGPVMVQSAFPHIKIMKNSAHALGIAVEHLPDLGGAERSKHLLPVGERFRAEPSPLAAILMLAAQDGDGTHIRRLSAFETVGNKDAMLFRPSLAYGMAERDLTTRFLTLLRAVPVFRFSRPKDLAQLNENAAAIEVFSQGLSDCRVPSAG